MLKWSYRAAVLNERELIESSNVPRNSVRIAKNSQIYFNTVVLLNILSNSRQPPYQRTLGAVLAARLAEPRHFLQVIAGPRQVGKTTMIRQILSRSTQPSVVVSADEPSLKDRDWLARHWRDARKLAAENDGGAILALDEVQKIPDWSESVKRL